MIFLYIIFYLITSKIENWDFFWFKSSSLYSWLKIISLFWFLSKFIDLITSLLEFL